ncbi:hypothetical protein KBA27_02880 [bacterium]|nr:hypothetical protein [bacterium]
MNIPKSKILIIVFALLFLVGITTVGCKSQHHSAWVNTDSLPGKALNSQNSSGVVYLGSTNNQDDADVVNFGPKDVNFDFKSLKR